MTTSKSKKSGKKVRINAKFADQVDQKIMRSPALFSRNEVGVADRNMTMNDWVRRVAMLLLSKTGSELIGSIETDRSFAVALASWSDAIPAWVEDVNERIRLVEHAHARALIALAHREDMKSVFEDSRAQSDEESLCSSKSEYLEEEFESCVFLNDLPENERKFLTAIRDGGKLAREQPEAFAQMIFGFWSEYSSVLKTAKTTHELGNLLQLFGKLMDLRGRDLCAANDVAVVWPHGDAGHA